MLGRVEWDVNGRWERWVRMHDEGSLYGKWCIVAWSGGGKKERKKKGRKKERKKGRMERRKERRGRREERKRERRKEREIKKLIAIILVGEVVVVVVVVYGCTVVAVVVVYGCTNTQRKRRKKGNGTST